MDSDSRTKLKYRCDGSEACEHPKLERECIDLPCRCHDSVYKYFLFLTCYVHPEGESIADGVPAILIQTICDMLHIRMD